MLQMKTASIASHRSLTLLMFQYNLYLYVLPKCMFTQFSFYVLFRLTMTEGLLPRSARGWNMESRSCPCSLMEGDK